MSQLIPYFFVTMLYTYTLSYKTQLLNYYPYLHTKKIYDLSFKNRSILH